MSFKDRCPYLGFGLGLRSEHYSSYKKARPKDVDWLEIISEGFLVDGGRAFEWLDYFKERYTIIPHGVSMSIGSMDPLNKDYLKRLKKLLNYLNAPWFSDHICWTGVHGRNLHNLMPLPYTKETVAHVVAKIKQLQQEIERPFIFENVSSYVTFKASEMTEWEFISEVSEQADCGILLDINNIYVSAYNHDFDPMAYLLGVPKDRVVQFHLAGHTDKGEYLMDTHDHPVCDGVWELYKHAVAHYGDVTVLLERDEAIPPLEELVEELCQARTISESITHKCLT